MYADSEQKRVMITLNSIFEYFSNASTNTGTRRSTSKVKSKSYFLKHFFKNMKVSNLRFSSIFLRRNRRRCRVLVLGSFLGFQPHPVPCGHHLTHLKGVRRVDHSRTGLKVGEITNLSNWNLGNIRGVSTRRKLVCH